MLLFPAQTSMTNTAVNGVEDFAATSLLKCFANVPKLLARILKLLTSANSNLSYTTQRVSQVWEGLGLKACRRRIFVCMTLLVSIHTYAMRYALYGELRLLFECFSVPYYNTTRYFGTERSIPRLHGSGGRVLKPLKGGLSLDGRLIRWTWFIFINLV